MKTLKAFVISASLLVISGCTHVVTEDYAQYLENNVGVSNLPKTDRVHEYALTPKTEEHSYQFSAATTGAANTWIVEFGVALDNTMMSKDVQEAFGTIHKITDNASTMNDLLTFDLQDYGFYDYAAHVSLDISYRHNGAVVFKKNYKEDGASQGKKMFWGGAFAQKNAVQQSTKLALDEILRKLITDLNALPK